MHPNKAISLSLALLLPLLLAACDRGELETVGGPIEIDRQATRPIAAKAKTGEWPLWRGPHGDGVSLETDWSADWPKDGPPILWKAKIGTGYSSISVADGRAYTMGYVGGNEIVWCFDAETGREIWKHSFPAKLVDRLHSGGPSSTPTVLGGRVFTVGKSGTILCLDAPSGEVLWSRDIEKELGVKTPEWGFCSSAQPVGDAVAIDAGRLVLLDQKTGATRWQTRRYQPGYGTPVAFETDEGLRIAVLNNDAFLIVDGKSGEPVAQTEWDTRFDTNSTTPIVIGETLFISSGYNKGCGMFQFKDDELKLVYKNKEMRNHFNNSVYMDGYLYGFDGNSHISRLVALTCMKYDTGEVAWKQRGFGCGSLMIAGDRLIVLGEDGELIIAEATPEKLEIISRAKVLTPTCWTVPVLAGGRIYCRNDGGDLVCVDVREE